MWGPVKPSPRPSGTALAAPCHSPYQSPLAAMPELQAAHLALGCPPVKPERKTPPQSRVGAVTAPTGAPATTDDWLPCVGACNLIGREAELGTGACDGPPAPHPSPCKNNRCGRGQAESESQGSWIKVAQLTKREEKKNRWHSPQGTGLRTASESTRGVQ